MATLSIPASVTVFPQPNPRISQDELIELIEARNAAKQLDELIRTLENGIKSRLESGADVQPGVHIASLKENFRRSVEWKAVAARLAERAGLGDGDTYCARVLTSTKPARSVSLVVS